MAPAELTVHTGQPSPRVRQRSQSISSDRPSLHGYGGLLSPPATVSPDPAFIAASAASQIVTNDHDSQADTWFDQHGIEPSGETALVSQQSLKLVNRFLDQLLFNFLSISKSTSLAALRPAVSEVLKPKLASGAINGADQELNEYLGGGEDEELLALHNGFEASGDWDLELVWKRTRLRCMVYSSLGDMEEEDEDYYTELEHLGGPPGASNRYSSNPGVVSPAVAIFLTSILEFMGEQVLIVAGQAAYHRLRTKHDKEDRDYSETRSDIAERVVVEDYDMERVALDRTLGRLWRGWKKRVRSPNTSISITRSFSRESLLSQPTATASKAPSLVADSPIEEEERRPSLATVMFESEQAVNIPLPMGDNDINEIEVPGLAEQSDAEREDGESSEDEGYDVPKRPKSLIIFNHGLLAPSSPLEQISRPPISRKRSNSVPAPATAPYISPKPEKALAETPNTQAETENAEPKDETSESSDGTKEIAEEQETAAASIDKMQEPKSLMGGVIAGLTGVAVVGAATVAGIVAAIHEPTVLAPVEEINNEEDEEAQIMTSSRVSIGGPGSPDDLNSISGKSSIRSTSVHSLRLIDVAPAKSPQRSRHGSVDVPDPIVTVRPGASRSNSTHSNVLVEAQSPRVGSPILRGVTSSPVIRNGSSLSVSRLRNSAGESIAEVDEKGIKKPETTNYNESDSAPRTAVAADFAGAMQGVDVETTRTPVGDLSGREFTPQPSYNYNKPSNFVLGAAPASRNVQSLSDTANGSLLSQANHSLAPTKATGFENGVPPLTPLRERMEGATDTSDASSSLAPSNDAHSATEVGGYVSPTQRAAWAPSVVRNSPPRGNRPDTARTITADSPPKTQRLLHTSGSQSSGNSIKIKATRTSEEDSGTKGQSFEQLIRSDQTIQYTLTPQNMRDIEDPDSPRNALPLSILNGQEHRPTTSRSRSSSVAKFTGLHSSPPVNSAASVNSAKAFRPIPRPTAATSNGSRTRPNAPQARDARIDRDPIGDFAEFIRSTGPVSSYEAPPSRTSSHRANGTARNVSGTVPRVGTTASLPKRAESSAGRNRNRLQARDAVVSRGDSISDLIDFVRSGPQLDNESHRIPRTVAPFRSTMDSDQMSGAVGGKAIDASLSDLRYSQATSNSVNSSITSQAPLLRNSNKALLAQKKNEFDEEDMMPKRKTRRVRDPYAIDFSDEEEEYAALTGSRPQPIEEESLADFLRNVPPPPETGITTSVFADVPRPGSKKLNKKSSSPSIMSRFGRSTPSGPQPPPKSRSSQEYRPPTTNSSYPLIAAPSTASNSSYSQKTLRPDTTQTAQTSRTKVTQKSYQPRDANYNPGARTNDLADFLMRSEPPTSMATQPQTFMPTVHKEEASAFQRMFGRKKGVH